MDRIFLTRADLKQRGITISNSTLLRREAKGEFPKRTYLTQKTVIWNRAEIDEFLEGLFERREYGGRP
jgi:predicted DNA-binding transcriptional regulator AlpA